MPWQNTPADRARDAQVYGPEYRRNAAIAKRRARGRCQRCGKRTRLQADHITPVSKGGTHALSNLQAICVTCHGVKTAQEGGGYRNPSSRQAAADPQPMPRTEW